MRIVYQRVGASMIPGLAFALTDGMEFVAIGRVLSPTEFAREYAEAPADAPETLGVDWARTAEAARSAGGKPMPEEEPPAEPSGAEPPPQ